jgi:hypothetical protein
MDTVEGIEKACKLINDDLLTVEKFITNYQRLMFSHRAMPGRILNVSVMPSWAIDAGTD